MSSCAFSIRLNRLRTPLSVRPGSCAAIFDQRLPCASTIFRMSRSSSTVHIGTIDAPRAATGRRPRVRVVRPSSYSGSLSKPSYASLSTRRTSLSAPGELGRAPSTAVPAAVPKA